MKILNYKRAFQTGKPLLQKFKRLLVLIFDFIFPRICVLCEKRLEGGSPLCADCCKELRKTSKISIHTDEEQFHYLNERLFFSEIITLWFYTKKIEKIIHLIKYQQCRKLGIFFGRLAGSILCKKFSVPGSGMIIPVPLHKTRYRERGYNQSELLAKGLYRYVPLQIYNDLLVRTRNTRSQTTLNAEERGNNMAGAFKIKDPCRVRNEIIILIDDVSTTGATMNSCAAILKEAGAKKIIGIALARPELN